MNARLAITAIVLFFSTVSLAAEQTPYAKWKNGPSADPS
jgi:hypothetical protein